jgi:hypothetical protein
MLTLISNNSRASIKVKMRNIYGNPLIYPICERAILFADIADTKTLNVAQLRRIETLGFEIVELQSPKLGTLAGV